MKLALVTLLLAGCASTSVEERPWLDAAVDAGNWLASVAVETEHGLAWPANPEQAREPDRTLYAGSPGVVVFLVELAHSTGDEHWLAFARAGADDLLASLPEHATGEAAGLYTGVAGVGYALGEMWLATNDERYRSALVRCLDVFGRSALRDGTGASWGSCNDVIAGTAGIGFFLVWSTDRLRRESDHQLAVDASARLVSLAEQTAHGVDWPMDPSFPRRMPNFSHGTAGIATFLQRTCGYTVSPEPGVAAVAAAEQLLAIADRSAGGLRVHHHTPGGEQLFYLGWCHGPCGTARLFHELRTTLRDERWREYELACARSVMSSGLPEQRLDGFWNNVSRCCGSAGVIEFMVDFLRETEDQRYLAFARRVARDVLARGTRDALGLRWIQAEHRAKPDELAAQTGLMQGAAGIGLALLHLDAAESGRPARIRLPDETRRAGRLTPLDPAK